ncbi:DUF421 domain-containing protein [uncultured Robinsoniella sp.]|uniref:DUF421 domain-containing protein n=1 Tax=uncultured Robinsoniella sp. TaxID=904190 RepID=UPI00374FA38C
MDIWELLFRSILTIIILSVMTKISGAKQIAQMTFYDYIAGIVVGTLAGELTINHTVPIFYGILSIMIFFLHSILLSFYSRKSITLRRILVGKPIFLIARGLIQYDGLKQAKFDINLLLSQLRTQGYFDISEVQYAILEPEGSISIMPKDFARPPKSSDFSLPAKDDSLRANIIIDGKIMKHNLAPYGKDQTWLMEELNRQGYQDQKKITLATLSDSGILTVLPKHNNNSKRSSLM